MIVGFSLPPIAYISISAPKTPILAAFHHPNPPISAPIAAPVHFIKRDDGSIVGVWCLVFFVFWGVDMGEAPKDNEGGVYVLDTKEKVERIGKCALNVEGRAKEVIKKKMLLCKQAEKGVPLQAEQADWLEDTDEEIDE
ncbi:hypothetical protein Tco_1203158 [Tanacetum coccineum]